MTKRQIFNGWQKITNTQITEDWATQTTKIPNWHQSVVSSSFTNSTSWAKELGAIALPTLKSWGGGNYFAPPVFGIKFKKTTVLL
jgi:hypothetical protein